MKKCEICKNDVSLHNMYSGIIHSNIFTFVIRLCVECYKKHEYMYERSLIVHRIPVQEYIPKEQHRQYCILYIKKELNKEKNG